MQKLKDTIKKDILKAALTDFYRNGYKKASMRDIAAKSGTTPGNIYRYFESKDALFAAVVRPAFQEIMNLLSASKGPKLDEKDKELMEKFLHICHHYPRELWIITYGSQGSPFERALEKINHAIESNAMERLGIARMPEEKKRLREVLVSAKCRSLVVGITVILESDLKKEDLDEALYQYIGREVRFLFLEGQEEEANMK